ncbi:MAG: hypothetical protein KTR31_24700 [Myxococcales bacterium]|nr:hypothetical protein [Myxococcales bacterium]
MALVEAMEDPAKRGAILAGCEKLVQDEVAATTGMSGVALRAGFKAFRSLRPDMLRRALERLVPLFLPVIQRHWEAAGDRGPGTHFASRRDDIADELLAVTDGLAERASNRVLVRTYRTLRGRARHYVVAAVPKIPDVVLPHLS